METSKEIKLTQEEAQVLVNIINIAVKSVGLEAAEAGVYFTKKLQDAFKNEITPKVVEKDIE